MISLHIYLFLSSSLLLCRRGTCFVPTFSSPSTLAIDSRLHSQYYEEKDISAPSRRGFLQETAVTSLGFGVLLSSPLPVAASGGATAGGAYLLSAKQRYNQRVSSGVKGFLALSPSLEGGSLSEAKAFFDGDDEGTWKDFSTAGYLLANAFRTSSTAPPDRLPSVKKWKAFEAEVTNMQKAVKKKSASGTLAAFQTAQEALDGYLDAVELPPSK